MRRIVVPAVLLLLSFAVAALERPVDGASAAGGKRAAKSKAPSYPIAADVRTTLDSAVVALPHGPKTLLPCQVSEYAANGYGDWRYVAGAPYVKLSLDTETAEPSVDGPKDGRLLSFFSFSDVHISDKETPAQAMFFGYAGAPLANSSAYSAVMLYTTHVLDAAIQTINALHKKDPFDFGIALGDACNNNQYNELRWYLDVIDGKKITPSSGAHKGQKTIDYQKPYQAAGLDKSIPWYQTVGNHDQFWEGSAFPNDYIKKTLVGPRVLELGEIQPNQPGALEARGIYMGLVDGSTPYGDIIDVGSVSYYAKAPRIAADRKRRSLTTREWMGEFMKTTTSPRGHGFTKEMINEGFACYHFYPKAGLPLKFIVFDDTDKAGTASIALDYKRYNWLVSELDAGEAAGELMVVCAHIPINPYTVNPPSGPNPPLMEMFLPYSMVSDTTLFERLHTYKNLVMWVSGHAHRNTITPKPAPNGDPEYGFWEVETPSLRDFPQQFRRFDICRNSDNDISVFTLDIDTAVNSALLPNKTPSPAWTSRKYAVATQQIFEHQIYQGPNVDPESGVCNAELIKRLSPEMRAKIAKIGLAKKE